MENPIKMGDLGVPLFLETSISWQFKGTRPPAMPPPPQEIEALLGDSEEIMMLYNPFIRPYFLGEVGIEGVPLDSHWHTPRKTKNGT